MRLQQECKFAACTYRIRRCFNVSNVSIYNANSRLIKSQEARHADDYPRVSEDNRVRGRRGGKKVRGKSRIRKASARSRVRSANTVTPSGAKSMTRRARFEHGARNGSVIQGSPSLFLGSSSYTLPLSFTQCTAQIERSSVICLIYFRSSQCRIIAALN